jgi:cell pole-organizing protein PopZ
MPVDGSSVENVFERAVRESFDPVLQKYLSDNSGAVIERMKPLIREWMDEHFPALLEGAVRAEVERVVKARGSKR